MHRDGGKIVETQPAGVVGKAVGERRLCHGIGSGGEDRLAATRRGAHLTALPFGSRLNDLRSYNTIKHIGNVFICTAPRQHEHPNKRVLRRRFRKGDDNPFHLGSHRRQGPPFWVAEYVALQSAALCRRTATTRPVRSSSRGPRTTPTLRSSASYTSRQYGRSQLLRIVQSRDASSCSRTSSTAPPNHFSNQPNGRGRTKPSSAPVDRFDDGTHRCGVGRPQQ